MTALTRAERLIADRILTAVGPCPVLLCGSRALGTDVEGSDYDIVVVMPAARIPLGLGRLGLVARRLEAAVGTPVSVNPLPAHRFARPGNLFFWKLRHEARILAAPEGYALAEPGPPPVTDATAFSYLASGSLYLLAALEPCALREEGLTLHLQRANHKCLLHVAQLRLLRRGEYASELAKTLELLSDDRLRLLACATDVYEGLLGIRDELLADLDPLLAHRSPSALAANTRYVALAALRGRQRVRAALAAEPVDRALARTATALLRAIATDGTVTPTWIERAASALPLGLRPRVARWEEIRDVVVQEWPDAHPLGAL